MMVAVILHCLENNDKEKKCLFTFRTDANFFLNIFHLWLLESTANRSVVSENQACMCMFSKY